MLDNLFLCSYSLHQFPFCFSKEKEMIVNSWNPKQFKAFIYSIFEWYKNKTRMLLWFCIYFSNCQKCWFPILFISAQKYMKDKYQIDFFIIFLNESSQLECNVESVFAVCLITKRMFECSGLHAIFTAIISNKSWESWIERNIWIDFMLSIEIDKIYE